MISPFPKPRPIVPRELQKSERLAKRGRMTIAIGMLCQGGIVVAADTQMTSPDGSTFDKVKVKSLTTATGAFAIAYSCSDINAAEMFVTDLLTDLNLIDPKSLDGLEIAVKGRMIQWSTGFGPNEERPYLTFILGAHVQGTANSLDTLGLYFCDPPVIILRKTVQESSGYVAIGVGAVVTDPIFRMLFGPLVAPRVCLAQLSYLMYRAKKDCRGACGGETDAVLLTVDKYEPIWIERLSMRLEEKRGYALDEMLARLTAAILSRNGFDDKARFASFLDRKTLRNLFGFRYGISKPNRGDDPGA